MNKKLAAVLLAGALLFGAAPLQAQESSSIDAVTAGVADTGRADKEAEKKITASTVSALFGGGAAVYRPVGHG